MMPSTKFLLFLLFVILDGILLAAAYPVSRPENDISVHILGDGQQQQSAPIPAILSHNRKPTPLNGLVPTIESRNIINSTLPSPTATGTPPGLNPNVISGIVIGIAFAILLVIAGVMYAFRVGWEKGQQGHKGTKSRKGKKCAPPTPMLELWNVDVTKPQKAARSCWDGGSWSSYDEYDEKYKSMGERYSYHPEKGVYEVSKMEELPDFWFSGKEYSGLGVDKKGKGRETPMMV